jgi:predicted RNase H-like nuclease
VIATGIDACKGGWVAVTLGPDAEAGANAAVTAVTVTVVAALTDLELRGVTGIDMPLGLLSDGWRTADALARRALGRRGVTVFAIPPRPVWESGSYAEANAACRELTGRGLSAQTWGLRTRLLEGDRFRATCPVPLYEVHPELSFSALAGAPVPVSKHSAEGLAARRELLRAAGITLPAGPVPGARSVARAGADDVLDATAAAWSARRILRGTAVVLTDPAQVTDDGREIAIRY